MSSSAIADTIFNASKIYTLAVYFVVLFGGLIGNICNIIVFNCLKVFRRNQCAFYLMVAAIADFVLLLLIMPFRITDYAFNYDPARLSIVWCKIRYALVAGCSLMSFASTCFAAIDQYLSTHYYPQLRQLSTLKLAHRLVAIAIVILSLHSIPFLIFFEIHPTLGCGVYNVGFSRYYSFVHFCVLSGVLPITLSGLCAALAYINVRRIVRRQTTIVRRRLDRQLTAMILIRVAFLVATTSPFVLIRIYQLNRPTIDPNDYVRKAVEQLISTIASSLFYINSAGTFYVFLLVSKRFRQQTKRVLVKNIWKQLFGFLRISSPAQNQVAPTSDGATDPDFD
ncbi:unnamed protein product [Rotaria sordida]|uniref:G-protein coupled receptors family 1 profile domain-containing protein n=1 Tax=Rotaria sordida TaxID=392033 RepID=A0A819TK60_9BILA|nr:unnamed protein product [Rotaria sordida]CAF4074490.1 unnamed protein product [Rotaria sordida]